MRLDEIMASSRSMPPAGTKIPMVVYHGSNTEIKKFNKAPHGVFFSPHKDSALDYGDVLTPAYIWAPKVYLVDYKDPYGDKVLDALFDRDYAKLAVYIKELQTKGYYALQTQTDSEMICTFPNAKIYSANTGEEM